ncbi:tyrosine-type recombinase/integrase [Polynucleobacter brandtiae]|uniref:Integrase-like protein n=1 Tax=Polynucleobacter brandtiae TaxID=1938816 RepID=A0A2M8VXN4_9BURK|nr:phage integrase SAM-like domain-containing protein [Polynucleobacter brandtiae]PJI82630.1 integrase-like protein [Polynucleobacter brandtiae]
MFLNENGPKKPDRSGLITLYKRPASNRWQCRFKLSTGSWHAASTNHINIDEAKHQAGIIHATVQAKVAAGLSVTQISFAQLAREELENIKQAIRVHKAKRTYGNYPAIIDRYLIPFFGRYAITDITQELVDDFEAWRESQMGRKPAASTKRYHLSAYRRIINLAQAKGLLNNTRSVPMLSATGDKGQARPAFTDQEIAHLVNFMKSWEQQGYRPQNTLMRRLLRVYVEFLLYTGIRQGTESWPIRWRHLQWHYIGEERYLRIWVSGKTGPRYLIAKHTLITSLDRLIAWQGMAYPNLNAVIEARLDRRIFVFPDGTYPYSLDGTFANLLRDCHLLKDSAGKNRTLYSLRHTYATQALAEGIDIHTLARQMGTSVGMIERHYSKLTAMMAAHKLAG